MNDDRPPDISDIIEYVVIVGGMLIALVWLTRIFKSPDTNVPPPAINP